MGSEDQTTTTRAHKEKENERFSRENAGKFEEIDKKTKKKKYENWEFADLYRPRKLILEGDKPNPKQSRRRREVRSVRVRERARRGRAEECLIFLQIFFL